jgi:hypothetical protein
VPFSSFAQPQSKCLLLLKETTVQNIFLNFLQFFLTLTPVRGPPFSRVLTRAGGDVPGVQGPVHFFVLLALADLDVALRKENVDTNQGDRKM